MEQELLPHSYFQRPAQVTADELEHLAAVV